MKYFVTALTASRFGWALGLMLTQPYSPAFWLFYGLAGVSDGLDGPLARRFHCAGARGAALDSAADLAVFLALAIALVPTLRIERWLAIWAGGIAAVRLAALVIGSLRSSSFFALHTWANKATGLLLFLLPLTCQLLPGGAALVPAAVCASFAAMEELLLVCRARLPDRDEKGILSRYFSARKARSMQK
ncbi:MAG: CDP-alcohol phosphatidyltransferase family protein [Eubacteriales bacterium]|nr:CDP-alcohol phosphatidyltransferase family protein [Eubacteriales bacterium]